MKLYFLRHASAEDIAASDAKRQLTKVGHEEARIAGAALAKLEITPDHILASPLVRAQQTAAIAAKAMKFDGEVEILDELENGSTTAQLLRALRPYKEANHIVLVGHMPSLSDHIAELINADNPEGLALGKGSVACVELDQLRSGNASLRWLMRQKQLSELIA